MCDGAVFESKVMCLPVWHANVHKIDTLMPANDCTQYILVATCTNTLDSCGSYREFCIFQKRWN